MHRTRLKCVIKEESEDGDTQKRFVELSHVMHLSAKRGHVCAADSLLSEDIHILRSLPVIA